MKKYILYAEDDEDDFRIFHQALNETDANIELIHVQTGYDLIRFLQDKKSDEFPALILMDINMPMLNGKETLDLLKLDERFQSIPVVLFSGSNSPKDQSFALSKYSEIIRKPSFYEEWLTIAKHLGNYCSVLLIAMVCK